MKRAMILWVSIVMLVMNSVSVAAYFDVPKDIWYEEAVAYVTEQGWMLGVSATEFAPELPASRAMVATVFWRMAGAPKIESEYNPYADPMSGWYYRAAIWAFPDIMTGYPIPQEEPPIPTGIFYTFEGETAITREQLAVVLYRWHGLREGNLTVQEDVLSVFPDKDQISPWAKEAVSWCVQEGYLQGDGVRLEPLGLLTRAQLASVLMRYCTRPLL